MHQILEFRPILSIFTLIITNCLIFDVKEITNLVHSKKPVSLDIFSLDSEVCSDKIKQRKNEEIQGSMSSLFMYYKDLTNFLENIVYTQR